MSAPINSGRSQVGKIVSSGEVSVTQKENPNFGPSRVLQKVGNIKAKTVTITQFIGTQAIAEPTPNISIAKEANTKSSACATQQHPEDSAVQTAALKIVQVGTSAAEPLTLGNIHTKNSIIGVQKALPRQSSIIGEIESEEGSVTFFQGDNL